MTEIVPYDSHHEEEVIDLALAAWAPVFDSMRRTVGDAMSTRLFGEDWREYQAADVRRALSEYLVSVAMVDNEISGFCAVDLPKDEAHGEIYMLAVSPDRQGHGIGTSLTAHAIQQIRDAGRELVVVNTGADPGHAAARATYEKAGFTAMPGVAYYLDLQT